jgi:DNA-directed RNA polymerase subunit RPC12/RpoP
MTASSPTRPPQSGVFCPSCGKKVGEELNGRLVVTCRGCHRRVTIEIHPK